MARKYLLYAVPLLKPNNTKAVLLPSKNFFIMYVKKFEIFETSQGCSWKFLRTATLMISKSIYLEIERCKPNQYERVDVCKCLYYERVA